MESIRTPEDCFASLIDYPFAPHYLEVDEMRLHYVDEGPTTAQPILLLHGEPSWSYLYRTMIPPLVQAGYRVIAPDLIGFGRSDKPVQAADHTYANHVAWITALLVTLNLHDITLFCQDWGGLIGLRVAMENEDRFARIIAANTGLPTGDIPMPRAFMVWRALSQRIPVFESGAIVSQGTVRELPSHVVAAYNAPFPSVDYMVGPRQMPLLVPNTPDDPATEANRQAWVKLRQWQKPFLTAFSEHDPITRGGELLFQREIPGVKGQAHRVIADAGHFLQEDQGDLLVEVIKDFIVASFQD